MCAWLEEGGHKCKIFTSGASIIQAVRNDSCDLLILDWLVPDMSGLEVLDHVRETSGWQIPILFATRCNSESDIVEALTHGADDYMVKPIKRIEMLARIDAISRRSVQNAQNNDIQLEYGPYILSTTNRTIQMNGKLLEITHREFELALFLFKHCGRILSRGYILEAVWGKSAELNTRTVDTHISRLRHKLSLHNDNGWCLNSIYQHGYRLECSAGDELARRA